MGDLEFYYLDILLTETYKNLGQYENITNPDIIGELTTISFQQNVVPITTQSTSLPPVLITGLTVSRLNEVRTYNSNMPYKINVNGVTNITSDFIEYTIDDILYKTFLSDELTTYQVLKQQDVFDNQSVIWNADSVFVDIKKTLNAMVIDRNNISVYDYINKINNCDELDDLLEIF
jgi:hypothetical protein